MEPGAVPVDADDIIQRYGRRLFVLAYHLTGDGPRADQLAQECLIRSLLEPAFPAGERETAVHLIRGLVSLWRERLEPPARSNRSRDKGATKAAPDSPSGEPAVLWRTLSRLDPTSRAVLVLRVAGDLEYETIGRILDMAADVVYARLLQARSRLHPEATAISNAVFETMNLYLDGRLGGAERGEFERLLASDRSLRSRVEFHRGLTLDLHEEAPPLPRDFAARIHDRLDRTRETLALVDQAVDQAVDPAGWEPVAPPVPSPPEPPVRAPRAPAVSVSPAPPAPAALEPRAGWGRGAGVAALVLAVAGVTFWIARRMPVTAPTGPSSEAASPSPSASPSPTPDEETLEALRSLGYLAPAPGKKGSKPTATPKPPPAPSPKAETVLSPPTVEPTPEPPHEATPEATPEPIPEATPTPEPAPSPVQEPAQTEPQAEAAVIWRAVSAVASPGSGRDHRVIRTVAEWGALFDGAGAPEVAFDRDMVVLLPRNLQGDPPSILVIVSVEQTAESLVIHGRREAPPEGAEAPGPPAAGQAIILPITDLPVRVIVR